MCAAPTESEKKLVAQLRERITDIPLRDLAVHDNYLVTWIRARDHDLKKAEEMIRKSYDWRVKNDIDNLLVKWDPPEDYVDNFGYELSGYDEDGCPIITCTYGKWDVRRVIEAGEKDLWLKHLQRFTLVVQFHVRNRILQTGKWIPNFVMIFDMTGFSFRQIYSISTIEAMLEAVRQFEANYPETLKQCYVINANKVSTIIFNIIKPLVSIKTLAKVQMFDSNEEKWKSALLKNLPASEVPIIYGGTKETSISGDMLSHIGRKFSLCSDTIIEKKHELTEVIIEAGDEFILDVNVDEPEDLVLKITISVLGSDIGFCIRYNDLTELLAYQKIEFIPDECVVCRKAGKYSFIFDNKYNELGSKTILYRIERLRL